MPIKYLKTVKSRGSWRLNNYNGQKDSDREKNKGLVLWIKKYGRFLFTWVLFLFLIGAISFFIWVALLSRELPDTDGLLTRNTPESTKIYDRTGEHVLYQIHGDERRTAIEITDLPSYVPKAFIAIEDKDFYEHNGLIVKRLVKAIYDDVMYITKRIFIPKIVREKLGIRLNKIQGASTITQQFIKNAVLSPEKKISRKLRELILAWQLERKFTKDQILKMYLNEISYGGVNYGIESATQSYFGKSARNLSIAEAATLAALINSPTRLSPYGNHKDELLARQKFVLKLMFDQKLISQSEYENAKREELVFNTIKGLMTAPHFVLYVRQLLEENFGTDESDRLLEEGGLRVFTTLDLDLQKKAEEIIANSKDLLKANKADNAALVALDPKTGDILSMIGAVDYFNIENDGNFNVAVAGKRQPGSSIKPLVYVAGFEKGYFPETVLYDVETDFDLSEKTYIPKNYNLKENGPVSIRKALAGSLNIPAVKMLYLVGLDGIADLAKKLGYTTLNDKDSYGLSLVLGGAEVTLLEHVTAYGAFANDGIWHPSRAILRIEDRAGKVIKNFEEDRSRRVLDSNSVRMLNSILSDNDARSYTFGPNNILTVSGHVVATKTGTTNDYKDAWTIGYTPTLTVGVWAGNNNGASMVKGSGGSKVAGPIWNNFMKAALDLRKNTEVFYGYPPNVSENPALNGSLINGVKVKIDTISGKRATEYTPEELIEERLFQDPHSILHYVDPIAPSNNIPENPSLDPQYQNWEDSIRAWITRFNESAEKDGKPKIVISLPPSDFDDIHLSQYIPSLSVLSPTPNTTFTEPSVNIEVDTRSVNGVSTVQYFIDERQIGTSSSWPYTYKYEINSLARGTHTLMVVSCDVYKNCAKVSVPFEVAFTPISPLLRMTTPTAGSSFTSSSFPLTFAYDVFDPNRVLAVNLYYRKDGESNNNLIHAFNSIGNTISVDWNSFPGFGGYTIFSEVIDTANFTTQTADVHITLF